MLTVPEAAFVHRSSVDSVYRWISEGMLASTAVGGKLFVRRSEIEAWLDGSTTTGTPDGAPPASSHVTIGLRASGLWDGEPL